MVATLAVVHRVGDYSHKPFCQVQQPFLRVTNDDAVGQLMDGVCVWVIQCSGGQGFEIRLYGIDTGRKAAFDDRVEVVWGGRDPGLVVKFAAQRVDLIATDFYESGVLLTAIFRPSPNGIVSERVMPGEVGLDLPVL